jgi:hypothetical protein
MVLARVNLPTSMRKVDMDFRLSPTNRVGYKKHKTLGIGKERKLAELAELFQLWIFGPATNRGLSWHTIRRYSVFEECPLTLYSNC